MLGGLRVLGAPVQQHKDGPEWVLGPALQYRRVQLEGECMRMCVCVGCVCGVCVVWVRVYACVGGVWGCVCRRV